MRLLFATTPILLAASFFSCSEFPPMPGTDGGEGRRESNNFLASDAGTSFRVGSAVYLDQESRDSVYLFESTSGRSEFCDQGWATGRQVQMATYHGKLEDGRTYEIPEAAWFTLQEDDGSSAFARSGFITGGLQGRPVDTVTGEVDVGEFVGSSSAIAGNLRGRFEAQRCPSHPYFEGGAGPTHVSGTLGFDAVWALAQQHSPGSYVVFIASQDFTQEACIGTGVPKEAELLYFEIERNETGPTETFSGHQLRIFRGTIGPEGELNSSFNLETRTGTLEATFTDQGISGTFSAEFVNRNGAPEDVSGAFQASFCP